MVTSLQTGEIDVGIGLTEGWVASLGKQLGDKEADFKIVGTYVESPLRWAVSTGADRDIGDADQLAGRKIGVSRLGRSVMTVKWQASLMRYSGSHVMGFVLADTKGWLQKPGDIPFKVVPLQTFAKLREAVNDGTADFFMWEHFTSKKYYDNGEIKRIGEIYTPWSSWKIVAQNSQDERLQSMFESMNKGLVYFGDHTDEALDYISTHLDYSKEDAEEWLKTVRFAQDVRGAKIGTISKTIEILKKAGVIDGGSPEASQMIGIFRAN